MFQMHMKSIVTAQGKQQNALVVYRSKGHPVLSILPRLVDYKAPTCTEVQRLLRTGKLEK